MKHPTRSALQNLRILLLSTSFASLAQGGIYSFNFNGREHYLSANEVDGEFCDPNSPLSSAGYFGVKGSKFDTAGDKHYFFWFFEKRSTSMQPSSNEHNNEQDDPVPFLIWLNGGPGCSSLLGALTENGPCQVNSFGNSTSSNPHSWNEVAHILYLDQPAKVGYSYGDENDSDEEMVAEDAYYFLQAFFQKAGYKYQESPLFLTGESYAGHYIPSIAHRILQGNNEYQEKNLLHLSLKGAAIGNPWIDPETQYKCYTAMASNNSHGYQILSDDEIAKMKELTPTCIEGIHQCNQGDSDYDLMMCQIAYAFCEELYMKPLEDRNISYYDITKPCIGPDCIDETALTNFLNLDSTKEALHVPIETKWKDCRTRVNMDFSVDKAKSVTPFVTELLNSDIPVLIYAGDLDYICNYLGTKAFTLNLEWDYHDEFNSAQDREWNDGGGLVRSSNGLTFLQVYDAGHMVPTDQPQNALVMITQFINGDPF